MVNSELIMIWKHSKFLMVNYEIRVNCPKRRGQSYVFFDGWISLNKTSILNLALRYCCPEKFLQPFIKYLIKGESIIMKMILIQIFLCPVAGWKSTWSLLCQLEKKFATQKESAHLSDISQVGGNKLFSKLLKTLFASLLLLPHSPCLTKKHCITTICDGLLCSVYEYKGTWFQQKEMLKSTWRKVFL